MKNSLTLPAIRLAFVAGWMLLTSLSARSQRAAHSTPVLDAFADKKSEVVETQDSAIAKFWAVADGSLLAAVPIKSPEYAVKRLRLMKNMKDARQQNLSGPQRTYKNFPAFEGAEHSFALRIDDVLITTVTFAYGKGKDARINWHQNTGKIVARILADGASKLYLIDEKDANDAAGRWKGKLLATYPAKYAEFPEFSESGGWLVDRDAGVIVNAATGALVRVPAALNSEQTNYPIRFSTDDSTALYGWPEGMYCVDMASGKLVSSLVVPAEIRQAHGYLVYPCKDGKSFVYTGTWWETKGHPTNRAWLVKEGQTIELVD